MNFTSFYPLGLLLKRLGLSLLAYSFVRGVFLLNNWGAYSKEPVMDLGWAFLHGIRFDVWTLAWVFCHLLY